MNAVGASAVAVGAGDAEVSGSVSTRVATVSAGECGKATGDSVGEADKDEGNAAAGVAACDAGVEASDESDGSSGSVAANTIDVNAFRSPRSRRRWRIQSLSS